MGLTNAISSTLPEVLLLVSVRWKGATVNPLGLLLVPGAEILVMQHPVYPRAENLTLKNVESIHRSLLSQAGLAQYSCRTNPHVLGYNFYVAHTPYGAQEVSLFT